MEGSIFLRMKSSDEIAAVFSVQSITILIMYTIKMLFRFFFHF